MSTANLPRTKDKLTAKEFSFFSQMISKIPGPKKLLGLSNVCFRYLAPADFTQEEFDRVGHVLTCSGWNWEELGRPGEPRWSYILDLGI